MLKVIDRSPVEDLVKDTIYFLPEDTFFVIIGIWEIIIGAGLLIPVALRLTLLLFWAQMAGTFLSLVVLPGRSFQDGNPFLLSDTGEFVIKNLVLIAAGLVIGATVRDRDPAKYCEAIIASGSRRWTIISSVSRILRALAPLLLSVAAGISHSPPSRRRATPSRRTVPTCSYSLRPISRSRTPAARSLLRFTTSIANLGDGALELRPRNNPRTRITLARQRIYTHDAGGAWTPQSETTVGHFQFHPAHNHWHFCDFATYELRNIASGGGIGNTVLATSGKVTFCMVDSSSVDPTLPHAAPFTYGPCTQTAPQGISVGWTDLYPASLPGQSLDITSLPAGSYWLV